MIKEAIAKLAARENLSREEAHAAMSDIMRGAATDSQIAGLLMALHVKGETVEEIAGCAAAMREKATRITSKYADIIDTCGTGGDAAGTFNISTTAAIIASAAGAPVAKHGNRAVSSRCGSADVLRGLGVNIELPPQRAEEVLNDIGITFLFAPLLHGAMKYAMNARKELGVRTLFNILGPLTNPAGARRQIIGVFDPSLTEPIAQVLCLLGSQHALVVHGAGGLDELSTAGVSTVTELKDGTITSYRVNVEEVGLRRASVDALRGGDVEANVRIVQGVLDGRNGPATDVAILNAGAAVYVAGKVDSLADGVQRARETVGSGAAKEQLHRWIEAARR